MMTHSTKTIDPPESENATSSLDGIAVEHIGREAPDWLRERRERAWSVYEDTPLPTTRSEEWRYTDLSRLLDLEALSFVTSNETDPNAPLPQLLQEGQFRVIVILQQLR